MKNKTSRTNKMKLKKAIVASLAIFCTFCVYRLRKFSPVWTTQHTKQENSSKTDNQTKQGSLPQQRWESS